MSLDDLQADIEAEYDDLGDEIGVSLDRETRNELAMLNAAFDPEATDELLRRAVHALFQTTVETGNLDFHLRSEYEVTYDEYLFGEPQPSMSGGHALRRDDEGDGDGGSGTENYSFR